ncbi:MAG: type II secretion system F family protein [Candidatus Eremiobacteraeota bacterium]|nr:type II secretion system F family protein [Candidatus Eremiobacteraeota bacterium]
MILKYAKRQAAREIEPLCGMGKFYYTAENSKGKDISGTLTARNLADARRNLEQMNYSVKTLREKRSPASWILGRWQGVRKSELALFSRQMGVLLAAAVSIRRSLQIMSMQGFSPQFSSILGQVEADIAEGQALSRAFARHPGAFDMLYVGMLKAGEASGTTDQVFHKLADHLDKEVLVGHKLKSAITYPAFIFLLAVSLAVIIVQHILPRFINGVFAQENLQLPLITKSLVAITNFLNNPSVLMALIGGAVVLIFLTFQFAKTASGKFYIQTWLHTLPGTRDVMQVLLATRFCRLFSSMTSSGIPVVHALELSGTALGDHYVAPRMEQAKNDLRSGASLAEALKNAYIFPPLLIEFLTVGEKTGQISELLDKLAAVYEDDIDNAINSYTALLEPLMLGFMGLLVGYVVIACFLPLYQLVDAF